MANTMRSCLEAQQRCSIVVGGGSTPGPCFDLLSGKPLDWSRVTVIPSDERWVPSDHPDSNERLIRERLLVNKAASGQVLPFYRKDVEPHAAVPLIERDLAVLATPVSCALLGMGSVGFRSGQSIRERRSVPCLSAWTGQPAAQNPPGRETDGLLPVKRFAQRHVVQHNPLDRDFTRQVERGN